MVSIKTLARRLGGWWWSTALIAVSLAVGVGAANVGDGVLDAVEHRALPYPQSSRLTFVLGTTSNGGLTYLSNLNARDLAPGLHGVAALTAVSLAKSFLLEGTEVPRQMQGEFVAGDYFSTIGISPLLGRSLTPEDDQRGTAASCLISERLFHSAFGGDPETVGRTVRLNGRPAQIIGVLPSAYRGILFEKIDVWLPVSQAESWLGPSYLDDRRLTWLAGVARLADGARIEDLDGRLSALSTQFQTDHADTNHDVSFLELPLRSVYFTEGTVQGLRYFALSAYGVFVLALLNLITLMLASLAGERRALALRGALGAAPVSIVRLAAWRVAPACLAGTLAGLALGAYATPRLLALSDLPPATMNVEPITSRAALISGGMVVLAALVLLLTALITFRRLDLALELRTGNRQLSTTHRLRGLAAVVELGLAVALVSGTLALLRSQDALVGSDMGFDARNLLTMHVTLTASKYDAPPDRARAAREAQRAAEEVPGVRSVSLVGPMLVPSQIIATNVLAEDRADPEKDKVGAYRAAVSAGAFENLGIPLVTGRTFELADETSERRVAIVSELLAETAWGGDAVGRRFRLQPRRVEDPEDPEGDPVWWEVVGVVGTVKGRGMNRTDVPDYDVYLPFGQAPSTDVYLLARTAGDPASVVLPLQEAVRSLDASFPRFEVETMEERLARQASDQRFLGWLLGGFSLIGVLLAGVGIFGVLRLWFNARRTELAVRLALGAAPRQLAWPVLRQALVLCGAGLLLGVALTVISHRLLAGMLFGVSLFDPWRLLGVLALLGAIALLSAVVPMRRAFKIDPVEGLRSGNP